MGEPESVVEGGGVAGYRNNTIIGNGSGGCGGAGGGSGRGSRQNQEEVQAKAM